ncbi:MAG: hypothetical protein ACLQDY_12705 [Streptosporangiaceae bacterium]
MAADISREAGDVRGAAAPRRRRGTVAWIMQAASGTLLVLLLGVHIVAQHFVVKGGLRNYAQVVSYLASPAVLAIECLFVVVLIWHAMLGLRAILLDLGFGPRGEARITAAVTVLGAATAGYSFWVLTTLAARG